MWRDKLREHGYEARRGCQNAGGFDSPDVICEDMNSYHFEVKFVEKLNIRNAMIQATADALTKTPIVAHKTSNAKWLVTMDADDFLNLVRAAQL